MRKIRDVLRLRLSLGLSQRAVGCSLGLSQAAVSHYLGRARRAGVRWPLPDGLDDERLEALLFPPPSQVLVEQRPVPDWAWVHRKRCGAALLPGCVLSVVGLLEAGSFELTLCLTLTMTRGLGIAG